MFRRCSDNDRRTVGSPSQTSSYDSGRTRDRSEHRGCDSRHHDAGCHADDRGHGHNTASGSRWIYSDASRPRDDSRDDGHGCSRGSGSASDVDDSADHQHHDEPDARQVGDG